jgi:hypothetical protein
MQAQPKASPCQCPVCGNTTLLIIERHTVGHDADSHDAICGVLSYKCLNGHVFLAS